MKRPINLRLPAVFCLATAVFGTTALADNIGRNRPANDVFRQPADEHSENGMETNEENHPKQEALLDARLNRPDGVFKVGNRVRITLRSRIDAFVYVFYHQADGNAVLLYPTFANGSAAIRARHQIDASGDKEGVEFRVSEPCGREVIQVLLANRELEELDCVIDYRGRGYPILETAHVDALCERMYADKVVWDESRLEIRTSPGSVDPLPSEEAPRR